MLRGLTECCGLLIPRRRSSSATLTLVCRRPVTWALSISSIRTRIPKQTKSKGQGSGLFNFMIAQSPGGIAVSAARRSGRRGRFLQSTVVYSRHGLVFMRKISARLDSPLSGLNFDRLSQIHRLSRLTAYFYPTSTLAVSGDYRRF